MSAITYIDRSRLASDTCLDILGLNIFCANEVDVIAANDPRIEFLKTLHRNCDSVALVGSYALENSIDEDALITGASPSYPRSKVDVYGRFYLPLKEAKTGYVITEPDLLFETEVFLSLSQELLLYDSLALFIPESGQRKNVKDLLTTREYTSTSEWIAACLDVCTYVVQTQSDGWTLRVYMKPQTSIESIAIAMEAAIRCIRQNRWYQDNSPKLVWDSELDCCLKLRSSNV